MKEKNSVKPEEVLFHELGHAIHAKRFGDVMKVPDYIIDLLQELCFPELKQMDNVAQSELFANVLAIGLMFETPYEKFNSFREIHKDDKKIFKMLAEKIIESL
jgi:hypothetical protein